MRPANVSWSHHGVNVGARQAGFNFSITADLLGLSASSVDRSTLLMRERSTETGQTGSS